MKNSRTDSCLHSSRQSLRESRGTLPHTWPALMPQEAHPVDRGYKPCEKQVRQARRGLRKHCVGRRQSEGLMSDSTLAKMTVAADERCGTQRPHRGTR